LGRRRHRKVRIILDKKIITSQKPFDVITIWDLTQ
jgi:hypothetical protein